jgi:hypothetical protein
MSPHGDDVDALNSPSGGTAVAAETFAAYKDRLDGEITARVRMKHAEQVCVCLCGLWRWSACEFVLCQSISVL